MDSTLAALQEILIRAIPTVLLVIVLHFYLKFVFLKPLREVLGKRYAAGEGARRQAEAMIAKAEQKTAEYESRLAEVRSQIYKEQEMERSRFRAEQDAKIEHSRQQAARLVHAAHEALAADLEGAKVSLRRQSEELAEQIATNILGKN